jgi:hypothetical protein
MLDPVVLNHPSDNLVLILAAIENRQQSLPEHLTDEHLKLGIGLLATSVRPNGALMLP